jgi:hypothetical protein
MRTRRRRHGRPCPDALRARVQSTTDRLLVGRSQGMTSGPGAIAVSLMLHSWPVSHGAARLPRTQPQGSSASRQPLVDRSADYRNGIIRTLTTLAACRNSLSSGSGAGAFWPFGMAAIIVLLLAIFWPDGSNPHKGTPSASLAAPDAYRPSRREGVRVKASGLRVDA